LSGKEVKFVNIRIAPKGQGLVEYALILVLVAIVVFAVLLLLGPVIGNAFSTINNSLSSL
jgi:pilus assembly protein Flp/PilA